MNIYNFISNTILSNNQVKEKPLYIPKVIRKIILNYVEKFQVVDKINQVVKNRNYIGFSWLSDFNRVYFFPQKIENLYPIYNFIQTVSDPLNNKISFFEDIYNCGYINRYFSRNQHFYFFSFKIFKNNQEIEVIIEKSKGITFKRCNDKFVVNFLHFLYHNNLIKI